MLTLFPFSMQLSVKMGRVYRCCSARVEVTQEHCVLALGQSSATKVSSFCRFSVLICFPQNIIVYYLLNVHCRCQGIDGHHNTMITTSHPSPLGAHKTSKPFMGSRYTYFFHVLLYLFQSSFHNVALFQVFFSLQRCSGRIWQGAH